MTKPQGQPAPACAGPRCRRPLPGPARTGRPGLYCSQACRQAALRRRRLDQQAPQLREETRNLIERIDPALAATGQPRLDTMDGEHLAHALRHARTAHEHLTALHHLLDTTHNPAGARAGSGSDTSPAPARPAGRGPRPGPGQQPVPAELIGLFLEPAPPLPAGAPAPTPHTDTNDDDAPTGAAAGAPTPHTTAHDQDGSRTGERGTKETPAARPPKRRRTPPSTDPHNEPLPTRPATRTAATEPGSNGTGSRTTFRHHEVRSETPTTTPPADDETPATGTPPVHTDSTTPTDGATPQPDPQEAFTTAETELLTAARPFIDAPTTGLAHTAYRTLWRHQTAHARQDQITLHHTRHATAQLATRRLRLPHTPTGQHLRQALDTYATTYHHAHNNRTV
ncbi:hypothetical protein AB0O91_38095 [Kitasatospora sp. NPDC089797]|uniref:hypothetical protein n=1 Tax=Kitasatospora sp. NPDC089797 TaxID=3155298 RepID=UPI0034409615